MGRCRMLLAPIGLLLLFPPATAFSATLYVPDDYTAIQAAIGAAADGDTVIVRPGTYVENIDFLGRAILVRAEQGPGVTTIRGSSPADPDSGSVVIFGRGEGAGSVLEGFTIRDGNGLRDHTFRYGGGIYCEQSSPTIVGNTVTGNSATYGGGIYCRDASPEISGNAIVDNSVTFSGAGLYCSASSPVISGNRIEGNRIGGGIHLSASSPIISGNEIVGNSSSHFGGGIEGFDSSPVITGNVITGNSADGGGGIYLDGGAATLAQNVILDNRADDPGSSGGGGGIKIVDVASMPEISNCLLRANQAVRGGGGMHVRNSTVSLRNLLLRDDGSPGGPEMALEDSAACTIAYSDVAFGADSVAVEAGSALTWGAGMIDEDPFLADPDGHLQSNSPAIDAGDPALLDACLPPGAGTARSDMGAYGGTGNCVWPEDLVEVWIDPAGPVVVAKGDTLFFRTEIRNHTAGAVSGDYWLSVLLPTSNEILVPEEVLNTGNPLSGQVAGDDSVTITSELFVPAGAAAGAYRLIGRVGIHPAPAIDEWWLDFEVTE